MSSTLEIMRMGEQIAELEKENKLIKDSDSLCKIIGKQKTQIEKMKNRCNCKNGEYSCVGRAYFNCKLGIDKCEGCNKWKLAND